MGLSNELSCEDGVCPTAASIPTGVFSQRFEALFPPALQPWVVWSVSLPSCSSWFICKQMWDHPVLQLPPFLESSLPWLPISTLLLVWMNVSSISPWFSDFHTVQFSVSSGYFLFLNLLLSFFWLCEEAKCIYPFLHLGQKSIAF